MTAIISAGEHRADAAPQRRLGRIGLAHDERGDHPLGQELVGLQLIAA